MESIKCVVVGDGTVGKTCLLIAYTMKAFPQDYVPTVFDNYNAVVTWDDRSINLGLWDTAGQDDFEHMRPISYIAADIFLLFFAIDNPTSFHNVKHKWFPEVKKHGSEVPLILVGTKSDIRENEKLIEDLRSKNTELIPWKQGRKLAKELGCCSYIECSAVTNKGFEDIFGQTILTILNTRKGKKPGSACWSTECSVTFSVLSKKGKCIRCQHKYCNNCITTLGKDHEYYPGAQICKKCKLIDDKEGPMIKPNSKGSGGIRKAFKKSIARSKTEKDTKENREGLIGSSGNVKDKEQTEDGEEEAEDLKKSKGKKREKKKDRLKASTNG